MEHNSKSSTLEPQYYKIKKWFLFFICIVDIVIYIVYASSAKHFARKWMEQHNQTLELMDEADFNEVQNSTIRLIVIGSLCGMSFQVCGLLGAYLENFYLTCVYSIPMTVGAVYALIRAFNAFHTYWLNTIWSLLIAICTLFYLWDLYLIRKSTKIKSPDKPKLSNEQEQEEQISFINSEVKKITK